MHNIYGNMFKHTTEIEKVNSKLRMSYHLPAPVRRALEETQIIRLGRGERKKTFLQLLVAQIESYCG